MPILRHHTLFQMAAGLIITAAIAHRATGENWPAWRGPRGTGVSSDTRVPLVWSTHRNLLWRVPLDRWGNSTPAIWGPALFLTTHTETGDLVVEGREIVRGERVWRTVVGNGVTPREAEKRSGQKFHRLHNLATPSPVTDGNTVVAHFGNGDLVALDAATGKQIWKRNLQKDYGRYTIWWGHANSPVLYGDLVISVCMQDSLKDIATRAVESYIVAHELRTGRVRWLTPRMTQAQAEECDAYTTPLIVPRDGHDELVIMGANQLDAYDPTTGKPLWHLPGLVGGRTVTGPTWHDDMIFATIGMRGNLFGARPFGKRGRLDRDVIEWEVRTGTPDSCSPVVWNEWLFTITDNGIARCYRAKTGRLQWKKRLAGDFKASPIAVADRVLFLNTKGTCTVVGAGPRYQEFATNELPDTMLASPAVSNGRIYLRGHAYLWCIGRK